MSPPIFISYARADGLQAADRLRGFLAEHGLDAWQDLRDIGSDDTVWPQIEAALAGAEHLVVVVTPAALESGYVRREWREARRQGATVSPVLGVEMQRRAMPRWLRRGEIYRLDHPERAEKFVATLNAPGRQPRAFWDDGVRLENAVRRTGIIDDVRSRLLSDDGGPVAMTSALHGRGGFGKTTIAAMVAQDPEIRDGFIDGVFWVTLGRDTAHVLGEIETLVRRMTGKAQGFTEVNSAAEHLARLLDHRDALLVVDDAWRRSDLEPFLKAARNAALLVTTRDDSILPRDTLPFPVDRLTDDEALDLLSRDLEPEIEEETALRGFAERFWYWAQLLAIANGILYERVKRGEALAEAIAELTEDLSSDGVEEADERGLSLDAGLAISIEMLSDDRQRDVEQLAVLPEDTGIPLEILGTLWGLSKSHTKNRAIEFERKTLLAEVDLKTGMARVHDNVLWYLRRHVGSDRLRNMHAMLLAAVQPDSGNWADLPPEQDYLWAHLGHHLAGAGQDTERTRLLTEFDWIAGKLAALGATTLYADYQPPPEDRAAALVGRAIGVSLQALIDNPTELGWQLWGRLSHSGVDAPVGLIADAKVSQCGLRGIRSGLTRPGPEILRIAGHEDWVLSATFSADGRRIVTASEDGIARVWDAETSAALHRLEGHEDWVLSAAFSADGRRIVTSSEDRAAQVWDAETGAALHRLEGHEHWVRSAAFSPDGRRIVTASEDRTARVWDTETGAALHRLEGHEHSVNSAAFSSGGRRIVTASEDGFARVWDAETGAALHRLEGHEDWVLSAAFSPDGRRVVTASEDRTARVWDAETGAALHRLEGHQDSVRSAAFSPDGRRIVTASSDRTARVWDAETGAALHTLDGHEDWVWSAAFSPDGRRIVTASEDRTARVWDAETGAALHRRHGDAAFTAIDFHENLVVAGDRLGRITILEVLP